MGVESCEKKLIVCINWINRQLSFAVVQVEEAGWLLLVQCSFWHQEYQTSNILKSGSCPWQQKTLHLEELTIFHFCMKNNVFVMTPFFHQSLDRWSTRAFSCFLHLAERLPFLIRNDESDSKSFILPPGIVLVFAISLVRRPIWWSLLKYPKHCNLYFKLWILP